MSPSFFLPTWIQTTFDNRGSIVRRLILAICISSVLGFVACGGGSNNNAGNGGGSGNSVSTITSVTAACSPELSRVRSHRHMFGHGDRHRQLLFGSQLVGHIQDYHEAGVYTAPSVTTNTQVTITATAAYDTTKTDPPRLQSLPTRLPEFTSRVRLVKLRPDNKANVPRWSKVPYLRINLLLGQRRSIPSPT